MNFNECARKTEKLINRLLTAINLHEYNTHFISYNSMIKGIGKSYMKHF
jgi:hypothetical protein